LYFKTFVTSVNRRLHHWHYDLEILLILDGSILIQMATEQIELKKDDLFLINRNEIHGFKKTVEDNCILALQIDPGFCREYFPGFHRVRFLEHQIFKNEHDSGWSNIRQNLIDLFFCSQQKETGHVFQLASHLNLLIYHLLESVPHQEMGEEFTLAEEKNLERLNRIIGYIQDNYREKLSLKELAQRENLDMFHLSHFIKHKLGISFQDYLNRLRLAKAVELMEKGGSSQLEICLESGFSDYRYLSKMFLNEYGCTPAQYKKNGFNSNPGLIVVNDDEEHVIYQTQEAAARLLKYLTQEQSSTNIS
jgi:AraC-like DNA-binding protein